MHIAVTGATGFLGGCIVRMALERGHTVAATGRNPDAGKRLEAAGATFLPCGLDEPSKLSRVFERADAVIHSAALSSPWGTRGDFIKANVEGTRNVASAMAQTGIRRLVHISTSSVYFTFRDQYLLREDATLPPPVNDYAATKREAEELVRRDKALDCFILRPRGIFGPGDTALIPRLVRAASLSALPLLRGGKSTADVTYVENVADAALLACQVPAEKTGTYNITNGEPVCLKDLIGQVLIDLGKAPRWRKIPAPLAFGVAQGMEWIYAMRPGRPEPPVTAYSLGLLAYSQTLDISKASTLLGWQPKISMEVGLQKTVASMKEGGR